MRLINLTVGAAILCAIATLLLLRGHREVVPAISVGSLKYSLWAGTGPSLAVRIGITNIGRYGIVYNQINFSDFSRLRVQSTNGWQLEYNGTFGVFPLNHEVLKPGKDTTATVCLPPRTLRWQVCYTVQTASARERVLDRIPLKWRRIFEPLSKHIPNKPGREYEIWSGIFECPMPSAENIVTAEFESDGLWPSDSSPKK
jgi:hypothetical protein